MIYFLIFQFIFKDTRYQYHVLKFVFPAQNIMTIYSYNNYKKALHVYGYVGFLTYNPGNQIYCFIMTIILLYCEYIRAISHSYVRRICNGIKGTQPKGNFPARLKFKIACTMIWLNHTEFYDIRSFLLIREWIYNIIFAPF